MWGVQKSGKDDTAISPFCLLEGSAYEDCLLRVYKYLDMGLCRVYSLGEASASWFSLRLTGDERKGTGDSLQFCNVSTR